MAEVGSSCSWQQLQLASVAASAGRSDTRQERHEAVSTCVSAYYYTSVRMRVRILLHLCPHTSIYGSSHLYVCVLALYVCVLALLPMRPHTHLPAGGTRETWLRVLSTH